MKDKFLPHPPLPQDAMRLAEATTRAAEVLAGIRLPPSVSGLPSPEKLAQLSALAENLSDPDAMFCQICRNPIPEKRKTRSTSVCSEKCKNRLDGIRARQRATRKCKLCLHPSTPEERAEFRQWRADRGDLKSAAVIVRDYTLPDKTEMANRLKSLRTLLEHLRDETQAQLQSEDAKPVGTVLQALTDPEKLRAQLEKFNNQIREISYLVDRKRTVE